MNKNKEHLYERDKIRKELNRVIKDKAELEKQFPHDRKQIQQLEEIKIGLVAKLHDVNELLKTKS